MDVTLRLERGLADVTWARHELLAYLEQHDLGTDASALGLVVSELVTNALVHGDGTVHVRMHTTGDGDLRVEVRDGGEGTPCARPRSTSAESGRGLAIVEALAQRWGVDATIDGKAVWAELATASWLWDQSRSVPVTVAVASNGPSATQRSSTSHGGRMTPPVS